MKSIVKIKKAIKHCREVASRTCESECANEHLELAKWLEDYIVLKNKQKKPRRKK